MRSEIAAEERAARSAAACQQLLALVPDDARYVGVYHAIEAELSLDPLIRALYARGVQVAFPVMLANPAEQTMEFHAVDEESYLTLTPPFLGNILTKFAQADERLAPWPLVAPAELDFLVVPVVAFNDQTRAGYGGGNYDRYLPQLAAGRYLGVAFTEQHSPTLRPQPPDIPLPILAA